MRSILVFIVLCQLFPGLARGHRSLNEQWLEVGLDVGFLDIRDSACHASARKFLGCIWGLKSILATQPGRRFQIVANMQDGDRSSAQAIWSHEQVAIIETTDPDADPLSILEVAQSEKLNYEYWRALYDTLKEQREEFPFRAMLAWLRANFIDPVHEPVIVAAAYNAMLSVAKDPHSYIVPRSHYDHALDSSSVSVVGIGVVWGRVSEGFYIRHLVENGPAYVSGIRVSDLVVEVNGHKPGSMNLSQLMTLIRGDVGHSVAIKVERDGELLDFVVERSVVEIPNAQAKVLRDYGVPIGLVTFRSFLSDTGCAQVEAAINGLLAEGVTSLVLDLRDNSGGQLDIAVCLAGLFLGADQEVVTQRDIDTGAIDHTYVTEPDAKKITDLPLAILVNERSASASEIFAALMQLRERAVIVGQRTFGKGTIQSLRRFMRFFGKGALVSIATTVARFHLPDGHSVQKVGVQPDIEARCAKFHPQHGFFREDSFPNPVSASAQQFTPRPKWLEYRMTLTTCKDKLAIVGPITPERADRQLMMAEAVSACQQAHPLEP